MPDTVDLARALFEYRPTVFVTVSVSIAVAIAAAVIVCDLLEQRRARRQGESDGYVDPATPRERAAAAGGVDLSSGARARRAAADRRRAGLAVVPELRLGESGVGPAGARAADAVRLAGAPAALEDESCFQTTGLAAAAQRVEPAVPVSNRWASRRSLERWVDRSRN